MEEQLLKDFIATAQANNYNYDVVLPKFPELSGYDIQVLKDYIATAEASNYDYDTVNAKFPELFSAVKKKIRHPHRWLVLWSHQSLKLLLSQLLPQRHLPQRYKI